MKRTWIVLFAVLVVAALALAACGQQAPQTVVVTQVVEKPGGTVVVTQVVEATPAPPKPKEFKSPHPDTLVVATIGDAESLDPAWDYESSGIGVIMNLYDQLVTYDKSDATHFVPDLATKWEISQDGKTYTFYIRKGVKFHNGDTLTPEDVAYTFQRAILQGGTDSPMWLLTEPFFGIGTYDIAELVDPTGALDDDPGALKKADPEKLKAACEKIVNAITYDNDKGTVTMHLAQPWGPFLATIAQGWASIIDKQWSIKQGAWDGSCDTWQNYYGVDDSTAPLGKVENGTGPYILDHWTPGEEIVLKANPHYWRAEQNVPAWDGAPTAPSIQTVVLKVVKEWGTRFAMLKAGDADFADVPRQNVAQVDPLVGEICVWNADKSDFDCKPSDSPDQPLRLWKGMPTVVRTDVFFNFKINTDGGNPYIGSGKLDGNGIPADFFSDIHVRKAFNYCFDWDTFIKDALNGEGVQNVGPLIPGMIGYDPNGPHYTYDKDKCVEELKQAWDGKVWEKGFRFQVAYNSGNVTRQTVAQILQADFADIDPKFEIEAVGLPWPAFLNAYRAGRLPMFISGWIEDIHDPHNWAQPFTVGTYARRQNMPKDIHDAFQKLVSEGVAETDPAKRAEIYKQLTELDYKYAPAIRLAVATGRHYEQRWVQGWYYNPIAPAFYYLYSIKK